jgi:3'-5' exonuclease
MLTKLIIQNSVIFDIETVGSHRAFKDLQSEDPHLAELWIKRCKWLDKKEDVETGNPEELWVTKSALHPEFGKIVCASFGVYDNGSERVTSFYGNDEKDILIKINKILANTRTKGFRLGGQNIKNFDIPYIGKRMLIHGIVPDASIQTWGKKPWELNFLDLAEVFSFGAWGQTFSSLDLISHVLGIPGSKDNMDGSQVHNYFWNESAYDDIKEYCEKDVICTMKCLDKISS